jgi:hypothetical protein
MKATLSKIREFLCVFKKAGEKESIRFVGREKNWDYLADTGITTSMREEALFSLSVLDYVEGPISDKDMLGELWVFGANVFGQEIYTKLKIVIIDERIFAKCISFHRPEHPLRYPFRDERDQ